VLQQARDLLSSPGTATGGDVTCAETDFGFIVVLKPGDEVLRCLIQFAREQEVDTAVVSGVGTISELELGTGGPDRGQRRHQWREPLEVCSLTGTLTLVDGEPFPHLHGSFARRDSSLVGGHVYQAVCATGTQLVMQVSAAGLTGLSGRGSGSRSTDYRTAT
jgi:uncharacterized protein